jgi:hypothetical protein
MTCTWSRLIAFVTALPFAMAGSAAASHIDAKKLAKAAWAQAQQQDSLEAYAEFAMSYPDSKFAPKALGKLSNHKTATTSEVAPKDLLVEQANESFISEPGFARSLIMVV